MFFTWKSTPKWEQQKTFCKWVHKADAFWVSVPKLSRRRISSGRKNSQVLQVLTDCGTERFLEWVAAKSVQKTTFANSWIPHEHHLEDALRGHLRRILWNDVRFLKSNCKLQRILHTMMFAVSSHFCILVPEKELCSRRSFPDKNVARVKRSFCCFFCDQKYLFEWPTGLKVCLSNEVVKAEISKTNQTSFGNVNRRVRAHGLLSRHHRHAAKSEVNIPETPILEPVEEPAVLVRITSSSQKDTLTSCDQLPCQDFDSGCKNHVRTLRNKWTSVSWVPYLCLKECKRILMVTNADAQCTKPQLTSNKPCSYIISTTLCD